MGVISVLERWDWQEWLFSSQRLNGSVQGSCESR
jgi:hypothetical protein